MADRLAPIRGEIVEIVGGLSSGRTSHLLACLGEVVGRGETAALVDTEEIFDPGSAAQAGIDLRRLLWVRCGSNREVALRAADMLVRCPGFALVALDLGERVPRLPATAAFRLKFAVRRTDVALLIVGRRRLTGSSAALAVETFSKWTVYGIVRSAATQPNCPVPTDTLSLGSLDSTTRCPNWSIRAGMPQFVGSSWGF
jgi:hypothetical protein